MNTIVLRRRVSGLVCTALCCAAMATVAKLNTDALGHTPWMTGWTLLALLGMLAALAVRRRLVMLPLVPVKVWVQVHIYVGLFATIVYALHVPTLVGGGPLETMLSWLMVGTLASGFYGVYLSRTAPRKLAAIGHEVRFDQIGWTRACIAQRADTLVQSLAPSDDREVLAAFYQEQIEPYLRGSARLTYMIIPNGMRRRKLHRRLTELHRYLSPALRTVAGELAAHVRHRDDLDYHLAMQVRLRAWRSLHALLTVLLLILVAMHVAMALRMTGA